MWKQLLFYRTVPYFCLEVIEKYFRVEVEGVENLPKHGPVILLPNHAGFMGFDALLLSHWIYKNRNKIPRILLHPLWFRAGFLKVHAKRFGSVEASLKNALDALDKKRFIVVFPEAEEGNFKPTSERYHLRNFRRGFVKMAAQTGAPIIPVVIIGAEETNINLAQIKVFNHILPLPLNYFPLPAKWKIKFLAPIQIDEIPTGAQVSTDANSIAKKTRVQMQKVIKKELAGRRFIYFDKNL